jgi:PGF-CTERM protein
MATPGASAAVERFVGSITAELGEYTGIEVDKSGSVAAIERIESDLESAVTAYENGSAERAKSIVKQTYLSNFEGVEGTLIEANPELVESLEAAFNDDLPGLIEANASASEVQNRVETMNSELETAEGILAAQESPEVSLDVEGTTTAPESTTAQPATTSTNAPGFTVVGALLALVGVGLLVRRR